MGMIQLPSLDAILQIKDPNQRFEELVNTVGILCKELTEINGWLTSKNIRANSITADRMNVNELSAITANIGHVISGIIESVEIYGSLIATAQGTYPRAEMSNTNNLFGAYGDATKYVKIEANLNNLNAPMIRFGFNGDETHLMQVSTGFFVFGPDSNLSFLVNDLQLGGKVRVKGGAPQLGTINISPASDPDDAVIKVNEIIAVLRLMGILE